MQLIFSFKTSLLKAISRFDLSIVCLAILTYCLIFTPPTIVANSYSGILACGVGWFCALKLRCESSRLPLWSFYAIGIPVFIGFSYYAHFYYKINLIWLTTLISLASSILISPFWNRSSDVDDIWSFQFDILKHSTYSFIASLILLTGTCFVLFALEYLFLLKPYSNLYVDIASLIGAFVLPTMILVGIPTAFTDNTTKNTGVIVLKLLIYSIIPVLLIYAVILHAYSLKILITQEFPKGRIAYLVTGFATFLIITYILVLRWKNDHFLVRMFCRHIGWLMVIPLGLMALGLWKRIDTFGLTEARYFLVALWIILSVSTIIILLSRAKPALWIISCTSGMFLIISVGPWSIQELPICQQIYRLKAIVLSVRATPKQIPTKEQQIAVSTILEYLATHHRLSDLKSLFKTQILTAEELSVKRVSTEIDIPYIEPANRHYTSSVYRYFSYKSPMKALPARGYTHIIPNILLSKHGQLTQSVDVKGLGSFNVSYSHSTSSFEVLQLSKDTQVIFRANMVDAVQLNSTNNISKINEITQTKDNITIQVIFTAVDGGINNSQTPAVFDIANISCILLIKHPIKK